jgi:predicted metal-dependent phosphoesterase TrpH
MLGRVPIPLTISHADLHIHPSGNRYSATTAAAIYRALLASDLRLAVLADHNRVDVARELVARSRDEASAIRLLVGEEISAHGGHLVGIGLTAVVPRGLSFADSVAAVHDQGGLAVAAHPLLSMGIAASERLLLELADGDPRRRPDALEAMHPVAAWTPGWRRRVERLAQRCGYAIVGGSDAHAAHRVGRGRTGFHGETEGDLAAAIRICGTWTEGRRAPFRDLFSHRRAQVPDDR